MIRKVRSATLLLLSLVLSSCAAGGTAGSGGAARDSNRISSQELEQVVAASDAYEAVRRLRPRWLAGRGGDPVRVFVDGVEMGDSNILRNYRLQTVREIRYTQPSDATMRYGTGFGGGVIEVITR